MKSKIVLELKKYGLKFPQSRDEVSDQEQLNSLRQAIVTSKGKPHVPRHKIAQEQMRVVQEGPIMSVQSYTSK